MFGPFSIFATENNLPLSGNVDQEIVLGAISTQIAGLPEVERQMITKHASYGDQLSALIRAVEYLAEKAGESKAEPIQRVTALREAAEGCKKRNVEALEARARLVLERLKDADERAYERVRGD